MDHALMLAEFLAAPWPTCPGCSERHPSDEPCRPAARVLDTVRRREIVADALEDHDLTTP